MSYKLIIEKTTNGYILTEPKDEETDERKIIIEDNDKDELESAEKLLWKVLNYFDFYGSKHDSERIRIIREKNK